MFNIRLVSEIQPILIDCNIRKSEKSGVEIISCIAYQVSYLGFINLFVFIRKKTFCYSIFTQ